MTSNPAPKEQSPPAADQPSPAGAGCGCECRCGLASGAVDSADRARARLGAVAGVLGGRDRAIGLAARQLVALRRSDDVHDLLGGMTLQVWLEHVGRLTGPDARAMLGAVEVLERMPGMLGGLCDGWLSWSQVAAICRAARRLRIRLLEELDGLVAGAMVALGDCEPGAIVADVWQWIDARQPSRREREQAAVERGEFVSLQPRLTGGGMLFGDLGAVNFSTVAERLSSGVTPPGPPVDIDPDDLDRLDDAEVDGLFDTLDARRRAHTRDHGAAMAARLVELCERDLAGSFDTDRNHDGSDPAATDPTGSPTGDADTTRQARPLLLATVDLDALCDQARTPGWILHTLAGGRMKVAAGALQRLVDERGADLRGIVLDDCGQVVGVGRRTHVPPGWLRQAIWARDVAVRDPDGTCPVRRADIDHIVEWPAGPTDVHNLHPVGRRWHNHKTSKTWAVTRNADGTTTWTHRRHGWRIRLAPSRRSLDDPPHTGLPSAPPLADTTSPRSRQPKLTGVP